jgi:hypothetical protein
MMNTHLTADQYGVYLMTDSSWRSPSLQRTPTQLGGEDVGLRHPVEHIAEHGFAVITC